MADRLDFHTALAAMGVGAAYNMGDVVRLFCAASCVEEAAQLAEAYSRWVMRDEGVSSSRAKEITLSNLLLGLEDRGDLLKLYLHSDWKERLDG